MTFPEEPNLEEPTYKKEFEPNTDPYDEWADEQLFKGEE